MCDKVIGNLKDLSTMPLLETLKVISTLVIGDIREIQTGDFCSLKEKRLSPCFYGGRKLDRISDAQIIMPLAGTSW